MSRIPSRPGPSPSARLIFGVVAASDLEDLAPLPAIGTGGAKAVPDRCSPARDNAPCVAASSGQTLCRCHRRLWRLEAWLLHRVPGDDELNLFQFQRRRWLFADLVPSLLSSVRVQLQCQPVSPLVLSSGTASAALMAARRRTSVPSRRMFSGGIAARRSSYSPPLRSWEVPRLAEALLRPWQLATGSSEEGQTGCAPPGRSYVRTSWLHVAKEPRGGRYFIYRPPPAAISSGACSPPVSPPPPASGIPPAAVEGLRAAHRWRRFA